MRIPPADLQRCISSDLHADSLLSDVFLEHLIVFSYAEDR